MLKANFFFFLILIDLTAYHIVEMINNQLENVKNFLNVNL